jgi:cytochrome c553
MKYRILLILLSAAGAACAPIDRSRSLNNPAVPARTIAEQVCSDCHGVDGNSVSPNFPRLAGQTKTYLAAQLKAFRSHGRLDPEGFEYMWGLSRHLSDEQIDGLAAYFSAQQPLPNKAGNTRATAEGKGIFESGIPASNVPPCQSCHGPDAAGNEQFPRLAGQHADYLAKQLLIFQRTDERPEGVVMKAVAHQLSERDIDAVTVYLQSK